MSEPAGDRREAKIRPVLTELSDAVYYEFGCRLDVQSTLLAQAQIDQARRLYNDLITIMRRVHAEMSQWVLDRAGPAAREAAQQIASLNERFVALSAGDDRQALLEVAAQRQAAWREQSARLKAVRAANAGEIKRLFLSRVANNARAEVYQCRCEAVDAGLGWATANTVLERALTAWNQSMSKGMPPKHHPAHAIDSDSLSLRFNRPLHVERLMEGTHPEIGLLPSPRGCGKRAYGELRFRLGPADAQQFAVGTWQHHRPLPAGAQVTRAMLLRRKIADRHQWSVQLLVREAAAVSASNAPEHRLRAVQFGWSADPRGRFVAAVASCDDVSAVRACHLPPDIEKDLAHAASLGKQRLRWLKAHRSRLAGLKLSEAAPAHRGEGDAGDADGDERCAARDLVQQELDRLRAHPQVLGHARIYRLQRLLRDAGLAVTWLDEWLREDRKLWQSSVLMARRARGRRRDHYRRLAAEIVSGCTALALVAVPAAEAKLSPVTGRVGQAGLRARAGRLVACVSELRAALQSVCARQGVPVFMIEAGTLPLSRVRCPTCQCAGMTPGQSWASASRLSCVSCGTTVERKAAVASLAWATVGVRLDELMASAKELAQGKAQQAQAQRRLVQEKRAAARAASAAAAAAAVQLGDSMPPGDRPVAAGSSPSRLGRRISVARPSDSDAQHKKTTGDQPRADLGPRSDALSNGPD